jgi:hypothetical protein
MQPVNVGRRRRSGKDELAGPAAAIHAMLHEVPDGRDRLPFIDRMGNRTEKGERRLKKKYNTND